MRIFCEKGTAIRTGLTTQQLWFEGDNGLIACWERGQEYALNDPDIAAAALADELVPLPWKGGVARKTKAKHKFGPFRYLAMWQGLRGDSLCIDTELDVSITCSRFGVTVTFTADHNKYANAT